ncbi:MAG: right-handed parallel beta-helix repeat-containing protein, partial [Methanosarcinales archaeon]|nr:right-handed parallel beta-helix repeat-containing protein [Methanosarcinales archaeon]
MKAIYIVCVITLLGAMMVTQAAATTWYAYDNATLKTAFENQQSGDTIFIYNGTYDIYKVGGYNINVPNLKVIGEGAGVVTLNCCGGNNIRIPDSSGNATGSVLDGVRVINSPGGLYLGTYGPAPDCIISNCIFDGMTSSESCQLKADNVTFKNNVILNPACDYCALCVLGDCCTIVNNTIEGNTGAGISLELDYPKNNIVTKNNFISNAYAGIELYDAGLGNKIYLNNFVDNGVTATTSGTTPPAVTYWNSTEQIEYTYNGNTYTNYLGNYWDSDYTGSDGDGDGLGDTSYVIPDSLGENHRPLMEPFENYPEVPAAADPDLTPISIANDSLSAGMPVAITVDVSNIESVDAGSFNVTLKVEETVIDNETVASLGAGSSMPVVFTWTPNAAGSFNLTAIVDFDDAVAESNETNNELTREVTVEEQSTPTPPTSFLISGNITYDNGNPVMNPAVMVTNLATSEDFIVKTAAGSNYYLTLTDSTHIATGNTILINATDGSVSSEIERTVTISEMNEGGFIQNMQLESGDRPDHVVTEKSEEWINPVDKTYTITYTVENSGTFNSGETTTSIKIDGTEVATDPVPALAIG